MTTLLLEVIKFVTQSEAINSLFRSSRYVLGTAVRLSLRIAIGFCNNAGIAPFALLVLHVGEFRVGESNSFMTRR